MRVGSGAIRHRPIAPAAVLRPGAGGDRMRRASLRKSSTDPQFAAIWSATGRTLRLLVATILVTVLIVMLLHGINIL